MTRVLRTLAHAFVVPLLLAPWTNGRAHADDGADLYPVAHWDTGIKGQIVSMSLAGSVLYAGNSSGMLGIIDVSDPVSPKKAGVFDTKGRIYGIAVAGTTVCVAAESGGVWILDASDPSNPTVLSHYTGAVAPVSVAWRGQQLVVGGGTGILTILDVSTPANPVFVSQLATGQTVASIAVAGNVAYLAVRLKGVSVADLSNPSVPRIATNVAAGDPVSVSVSGGVVYAATSGKGLAVLDVSDPLKPVLATNLFKTSYMTASARSGALISTISDALRLFRADDPLKPLSIGQRRKITGDTMAMNDRYVFLSDSASVDVVAIGGPANPQTLTTVPLPASGIRNVFAFQPGLAYLRGAPSVDSFTSYDISDPANPVPRRTNAVAVAGGWTLSSAGSLMLCWGGDSVKVFDTTHPLEPDERSAIVGLAALSLGMDPTRAFFGRKDGLESWDMSDPANPTRTGSVTNSRNYTAMVLRGDRLYAGTTNHTVQVFDVSIAGTYTQLSETAAEGIPKKLMLSGDRLFLIQDSAPVVAVYSLVDPVNPVRLGAYAGPLYRDAVLQGNHLYGMISLVGFDVLDVGQPGNIRRVAGSEVSMMGIATDGRWLYGVGQTDFRIFPLYEPPFLFLAPSLAGGSLALQLKGAAGRTGVVERAGTLGDWKPWRPVSFDQDIISLGDTPDSDAAFYRLVLP